MEGAGHHGRARGPHRLGARAERVAAVAPAGVDAALDTAGSGSLAEIVALVGDASRVATIADFGAADLGVTLVAGNVNAAANLAEANRLGESGAYAPRIQRAPTRWRRQPTRRGRPQQGKGAHRPVTPAPITC